jgi:hypothetical protein
MTDDWITDEYGTERYRYEGWEIVCRPGSTPYIFCPDNDVEVNIEPGGLWVRGERHSGGYGGFEGVGITIPWRILAVIIEKFGSSVV